MESSESQSHSLINTVQNSSELSELQIQQDGLAGSASQSSMDKKSTIDCLFRKCNGVMGVPITFLDKYCPEQFEIIWQASGNTRASTDVSILMDLKYTAHKNDRGGCGVINGARVYSRILVKSKNSK